MKKIKLLLMFLLMSFSLFAFKMEGITFNKSLENGYKEFKIHNDGTKKVRYKVIIKPSGNEDITDCIEVFPKILTIEPKSSQVLKMFGKAKRKLENKEYSFRIEFQQIIIPTLAKSDGKTIAGNSAMGLSPSVEMKGYGGQIDYSKSLELKNISFEKDKKGNLIFKGTLVNHSHGATELGINLYNRDKSVFVSEGLGGIEANTSKELNINLKSFTNANQIKSIEFYNDTYEVLKEVTIE